MNKVTGPAVSGRLLYDGDILNCQDGKIQFRIIETGNQITLSGLSELRINCNKQACELQLNYGKLFSEVLNNIQPYSSCITSTSEVILDEGEVWISRSIAGKDEVYAINGQTTIYTEWGVEQYIQMGEMLIINSDGSTKINKITEGMLLPHIMKRLGNNLMEKKEKPFTVMNYYIDDPAITQAFQKETIQPFKFYLGTGVENIERSQYFRISLIPMYTGKHIKVIYSLNGFFGLSDSSKKLNTFNSLSRILAPLSFEYKTSKGNFHLKLGRLSNLTFGYGMLLKRFTNTVSSPMQQDGGLAFDYKTDAENYTLQFFTSSIEELSNGSGIGGIYATAVIPTMKSLRIGAGFVIDKNQFYPVPDSLWMIDTPIKRSFKGYQVDFTYELASGLRNDLFLFGEVTVLNAPDTLRYIRSEEVNWDTTTAEQGFERKSSFGILGPGIHWKLGHHRDIKIAFNYSSSLHMAPFFGETYNLERVHYVPKSIIDSIDINEPFNQDEKWNTMIKENHIDGDSTAYYLPKDVFMLLNPTQNAYNKMGVFAQYSYNYRNYYEYSFDMSVFQEIGAVESSTTYYTVGLDFFINDGLIDRISECGMYFNQYFTSELLNSNVYNENMVLGARLGIQLMQNVSLRIYRHDVFYDNNLDGNVDLNSTMGLGLMIKFK